VTALAQTIGAATSPIVLDSLLDAGLDTPEWKALDGASVVLPSMADNLYS